MSTRGRWLALAALAGVALLAWLGWRATRPPPSDALAPPRPAAEPSPARAAEAEPGPVRPVAPPVEGRDEPPAVDEPSPVPDGDALRRAAYAEAVAREEPRPGEQAFRAMVTAFIEHNHRHAEAQAKAEGLGIDEVEELTFLGLMAQESQRWDEVEQVLGGPVDADKRARSEAMLHELDAEFERSMRDLVADGASVEDRWALIRSYQTEYRDRYFEITGMDEDLLDDLLAGDSSRDYAPGSTPPPEDMPPREDGPTPIEPRAEPPPPPPPQ